MKPSFASRWVDQNGPPDKNCLHFVVYVDWSFAFFPVPNINDSSFLRIRLRTPSLVHSAISYFCLFARERWPIVHGGSKDEGMLIGALLFLWCGEVVQRRESALTKRADGQQQFDYRPKMISISYFCFYFFFLSWLLNRARPTFFDQSSRFMIRRKLH